MQPGPGTGGLEGAHTLSQQAADEPGKDVPCPRRGQESRGIGVDGGLAIRARDHGIAALEQDDAATDTRGATGGLYLAGRPVQQAGEKPLKLALMGRQDTAIMQAGK